MVGITVRIRGEEKIYRFLKNISTKTEDVKDLWDTVLVYLMKKVDKEFREEKDYKGQKWKPIKKGPYWFKKYAPTKGKPHDKILVWSGILRNSFSPYHSFSVVQKNKNRLIYGSKVPYAAVHQFGSRKRNIPARPILGLTDRDKKEIIRVFTDYFRRSWK